VTKTDDQTSQARVRPFQLPRRWYRKKRSWVVIGVVATLVAGGLVWWSPWRAIRVTDGSDAPFAPDLANVQRLIYEENQRVADQPYVTIAFMLAISADESDPNTPASVRHELQGAYLAQFWANHPDGEEKQRTRDLPMIRLLLADTGPKGDAWQDTVEDLTARVASEHLVAVAGLGSSLDTTQSAVDRLADARIPMFGAVITSSRLSGRGLVRVAPTNADEAAALVGYLSRQPEWQRATEADPDNAYLVRDIAPNDTYAHDLADVFQAAFEFRDQPNSVRLAHAMRHEPGDYDSQKPAAGNALSTHVNEICSDEKIHLVFFAGRSAELKAFLDHLARSGCAKRDITVVTGDDADHLAETDGAGPPAPDPSGTKLVYAGLATDKSWQHKELFNDRTVEAFTGPADGSYRKRFDDPLVDGHAIMAHDAMLTAITATRNSVDGKSGPQPSPDALINGIAQITANRRVPGASGWIELRRAGDTQEWRTRGKAVPILQVDRHTGQTTLLDMSTAP
jgi:ABC-type branched-subunit amino acid transport system substrate-binding protein